MESERTQLDLAGWGKGSYASEQDTGQNTATHKTKKPTQHEQTPLKTQPPAPGPLPRSAHKTVVHCAAPPTFTTVLKLVCPFILVKLGSDGYSRVDCKRTEESALLAYHAASASSLWTYRTRVGLSRGPRRYRFAKLYAPAPLDGSRNEILDHWRTSPMVRGRSRGVSMFVCV